MGKSWDKMTKEEKEKVWVKRAERVLLNKKIVKVRWMTMSEQAATGWDGDRAIILELDDGTLVYPSRDDEGNGPGALFTTDKKEPVLPVLWGL